MTDTREQLVTENPWKLMATLCIPAIIGMVVIGLYTFMDGIFAGQLIGSAAMAAISVAYPLTLINSGISTLVGVGSASVLSRAIGKKDQETVDKIMGNLAWHVIILSLIVTVIGIIFTRPLLKLTGAEGEILNQAERYLRIIYIGSFFVNFTQSANMVMRGQGLMKQAMLIMGTGALLNIAIDPLLIKLMGGRIEGAAIATLICQVIQCVITVLYFSSKKNTVRIHAIKRDKDIQKEMLSVGVSAMFMQVLTLVQQSLIYRMAFKYGGESNGILMSAAMRIQAFSFIPLWGMSQGLQPVVGTNYGAKLYDRVKKSVWTFILGATVLALCFWVPIQIFPNVVLGWFIKDATLVQSGIANFRLMYLIFPFYGAMIMMITFFQSIGNGKAAGVLVFLRQIILFVPAIILIPMLMGTRGVWCAGMFVDAFVVIFGFVLMAKAFSKINKQASLR